MLISTAKNPAEPGAQPDEKPQRLETERLAYACFLDGDAEAPGTLLGHPEILRGLAES